MTSDQARALLELLADLYRVAASAPPDPDQPDHTADPSKNGSEKVPVR